MKKNLIMQFWSLISFLVYVLMLTKLPYIRLTPPLDVGIEASIRNGRC
jgi:hypothetical protein